MHRIGTDASAPVDNWEKGGLSCGIDIDSGKLLEGAPKPTSAEIEWVSTHPDTGAQIKGITIPNGQRLCESVCNIASFFDQIPIIAWDIVVTDGGPFKILEANGSKPGIETLQMHKPLLKDEKNRRFLKEHGVL